MNSFFNFQVGTFAETSPGWFDWLSLIVTSLMSVIGILAAYCIAKGAFKKEQRLKSQNEGKLRDIEMIVFKERLWKLYEAIDRQIDKLEASSDLFVLEITAGVNVDFLQSTDFTKIYEKIGIDNKEKVESLNNLIIHLTGLSNLPNSIREEGKRFNEKYNFHEQKFYLYRKLLYTNYYELVNSQKYKAYKSIFRPCNKFINEYHKLLQETSQDSEIIKVDGTVCRKLLVERFVKSLIHIAYKYIPEERDAISTSDMANEVLSAYQDMEVVEEIFKLTKDSYKDILKRAKEAIKAIGLISDRINEPVAS